MRLSTGDLNDSLVSEWLQDHGGEHLIGTAMPRSTEFARTITKHISISREVKCVVSSTGDLLEMAHLVLHSISVLDLLSLQLLSLCVLNLLFIVIEGEQLLLLFHFMLLDHLLLMLLLIECAILVVFVPIHVVLVRGPLECWSIVVLAHVVVCLTKPVRGSVLHIVGLLSIRILSILALVCAPVDVASSPVRSLGPVG